MRIVSFLFTILFSSVFALDNSATPNVGSSGSVDGLNHRPYLTNSNVILAGKPGSKVQMHLKGVDPEDQGAYFVMKSSRPFKGVKCWFDNANILTCAIPNIRLSENDTCMVHGTEIEKCREGLISFIIKDNGFTDSENNFHEAVESKEIYKAIIRVTDTEIGEKDRTFDPRAWFYSEQEKWKNSPNGNWFSATNPSEGVKELLLPNIDPGYFKKAADAADVDPESLTTENVNKISALRTAVGDAKSGLDSQFISDIRMLSVNNAGFEMSNLPIYCDIERGGIYSNTYFVCTSDPSYPRNMENVTRFYAFNGSEQKAETTCLDSCVQYHECGDISTINYEPYFVDMNNITKADATLFGARFKRDDYVDGVYIVERLQDGTMISAREMSFEASVSGDRFRWYTNESKIFTSNKVNDIFRLEYGQDTTSLDSFTSFLRGNSLIVQPKYRYYVRYKYQGIWRSTHQNNNLFSVYLKIHKPKYRCSIEGNPDQFFEKLDTCSDSCYVQNECIPFSTVDNKTVDTINNHCKDVSVNIAGVRKSLESAVASNECILNEEYSIDIKGNPRDYYVKNRAEINPLRPNIGFSEDPSILHKENAISMAGSYMEMINNGESDGRFLKTDFDDDNSFKDFKGNVVTDSQSPSLNLLRLSGRSWADQDLDLLTMITPKMYREAVLAEKRYGVVIFTTNADIPIVNYSSKVITQLVSKVFNGRSGSSDWLLFKDFKSTGNYDNNRIDILPRDINDTEVWFTASQKSASTYARVIDPTVTEQNGLSDEDKGEPIRFTPVARKWNLYEYAHGNVFAYIDTMDALSQMTLQDVHEKVLDSHRAGNRQYLVWDFQNHSDVLIDDGRNNYRGLRAAELNKYTRIYSPNDLDSFFLDLAGKGDDHVLMNAVGDTLRFQMAPQFGTTEEETEIICPDGSELDNYRCYIDISQDSCLPGFNYVVSRNQCESPAYCENEKPINFLTGMCGDDALVSCPDGSVFDVKNRVCVQGTLSKATCKQGFSYDPKTGMCSAVPVFE